MGRDNSVDTLRGLACIFLVAYHVIGGDPSFGFRIESGIFRDVNDLLALVRMPLFTFLSGVVYAYRPFTTNVSPYLAGKARRLLIPMLVVGTTFALIQEVTPGTNSNVENWYLLHILPVAHFWFLESIFLIFTLMVPLELLHLFHTKTRFLIILALAIAVHLSGISIPYFSISGAIYLLPYFLIGMAFSRYKNLSALPLWLGWFILVAVSVCLALMFFDYIAVATRRTIGSLIVGSAACVGLFISRFKSGILAWIGGYSYTIYLYHVFFTAAAKLAFENFGIDEINILFLLALLGGLGGPIVIEILFSRWNLSRYLLLGKSKLPVDSRKALI